MRTSGCTHGDYLILVREFNACGFEERRCCGAPSLLSDLEEYVQVSEVISQAASVTQQQSQAQTVTAPPGDATVVYHPSLPEGDLVMLDDETVMVGTGGIGKMHMTSASVAQAQGYVVGRGAPLKIDDSPLVRSGVLIVNRSNGTVNFQVGGSKFSLAGGASRRFSVEDKVRVAFDQGSGRKLKEYNLTPGTCYFDYVDGGWALFKSPKFEVTIDNRDNDEAFHYIIQGEYATVEAHATRTHTSDYPPTVRFDRGNGRQYKQVVFQRTQQSAVVAVNPDDNLWTCSMPAPLASLLPLPLPTHLPTRRSKPTTLCPRSKRAACELLPSPVSVASTHSTNRQESHHVRLRKRHLRNDQEDIGGGDGRLHFHRGRTWFCGQRSRTGRRPRATDGGPARVRRRSQRPGVQQGWFDVGRRWRQGGAAV
jgi:hypothetical protein